MTPCPHASSPRAGHNFPPTPTAALIPPSFPTVLPPRPPPPLTFPRRCPPHPPRARPRGQRSPRHDPNRLPAPNRAHSRLRPVAGLHLAYHLQPRPNLRHVRRSQRISIASRPSKSRKVAVRQNPLRKHTPQTPQQFHRFHLART